MNRVKRYTTASTVGKLDGGRPTQFSLFREHVRLVCFIENTFFSTTGVPSFWKETDTKMTAKPCKA